MEQYKIDFKAVEWQSPLAGIRSKAYQQDGKKLRLVEFAKEFVESDWCTKGHIGYILDGQMEIDFEGKAIIFNSGDGIFIPAGQKHKAKILTDMAKAILVEDV